MRRVSASGHWMRWVVEERREAISVWRVVRMRESSGVNCVAGC